MMNKPPEIRTNPGCLWAFAVGFFYLPALLLLAFAGFAAAGACMIRIASTCLPTPDYLLGFAVLGGAFLVGGITMSLWALQQGK